MSQQLALSSLFSVIALASLCLAATSNMVSSRDGSPALAQPYSVQAETVPDLNA